MNRVFRCSLIVLMVAAAAHGQNQTRPEFEAASVKVSPPDNVSTSFAPTLDARPGGALRIVNRRSSE